MRRPPTRGRLFLVELRNTVVTTLVGLVLIALLFGLVIGLVAVVTR